MKGEHKGFAPGDPNSFDVDAFILSDKLYNSKVFKPSDWWRSGSKIKALKGMQREINEIFGKDFSGYRSKDRFVFRLFSSEKLPSGGTIL